MTRGSIPQRIRQTLDDYPREFWILVGGTLVNAAGSSLVFPFFTLYVRQRFGIPMASIGAVMSVMATAGLASGALGGALADRFGRKTLMVGGLLLGATALFGMGLADSPVAFAAAAIFLYLVFALYGPASQAMVADLVAPDQRASLVRAYGLIRVAFNLGVAVGPAAGGFLAQRSYFILFAGDALTSLVFALIILFFIAETRPQRQSRRAGRAGYGPLLRDTPFMLFCLVSVAVTSVYAQMNSTWPVYMKEYHAIPEWQFGLMMSMNAAMVVLFQFPITAFTERYARGSMLALGAVLYAAGFGLIGFVGTAPLFALATAIWTVGEMVHVPVAQAYVADSAPEDMRGRYMGAAGLTWGIGWAIGPLLAGLVMDGPHPQAVWYACLAVGLAAALAFLRLGRRGRAGERMALDEAGAAV